MQMQTRDWLLTFITRISWSYIVGIGKEGHLLQGTRKAFKLKQGKLLLA
jgi:hypothetical protein